MKTKIFLILICNLLICPEYSGQFAQNITNTLGTSGIFKIKDGSSDYLTLTQSTGQVNILKTLMLANTTNSTTGVIFKGINRFMHNFGTDNIFLGLNSGNFTMTGTYNVGVGSNSLFSNTTGYQNSAFGYQSLNLNTTGYQNSAVGYQSLLNNTTGYQNSAFGYVSLGRNTTGYENSGFGSYSLFFNTTGSYNTAVGYLSLYTNTLGNYNSAFGDKSLYSNTIGYENSTFGYQSLYLNTSGNYNSAFGHSSLYANTTGYQNSAFGYASLLLNETGKNNSAFGIYALYRNTTGSDNSAVGVLSLSYNTSGHHNSVLGILSGSTITTGSNLTCLGHDAQPTYNGATDQITLGNNQITSLRCNVTTITSLSDMRDKKNIKDLTLGLDFISKLKPRLYNWDKREWYDDNVSDGSKTQETPTAGFIAQELDELQTSENAQWLNLVLKDNPEKWEATPGNLFPIVVKAVQELKAENDGLKSENNELKERLSKLEEMQSVLALEIEKMNSKDSEVKEIKLGEK